jgi:hypothetical protein
VKTRFQAFAFECNLYRYDEDGDGRVTFDELIQTVKECRAAGVSMAGLLNRLNLVCTHSLIASGFSTLDPIT